MNKYAEHSKARSNQARQENIRCVTKRRYVTEDSANGSASKHGCPMRAYLCPLCLGWHLTSKGDRVTSLSLLASPPASKRLPTRQPCQESRDALLRLSRMCVGGVEHFDAEERVVKLIGDVNIMRTKYGTTLWGRKFRFLRVPELSTILVVRAK